MVDCCLTISHWQSGAGVEKHRGGGATYLIICRVGSGSGRLTSGFGSKNVGPCPAHDMVGSGWVGLARNFVCNFWVGSGFFLSFGSNILARIRPVT